MCVCVRVCVCKQGLELNNHQDLKPNNITKNLYIYIYIYKKGVRQWPGRPGFNPRSSHTKDFKNGT